MSSKIDFKDCYSDTSVAFLDTVVKLQNGQLVTDLFNKPTASFDYVHRSSYHPQHLINSIPKSQFIRIRRICTFLRDYKKHAEKYIGHFKARGYKEAYLRKVSDEVARTDRASFLTYRAREKKSDRVPLVLTYHHKLQDLPFIVRRNYQQMIRDNPEMKTVFPAAPVVSFRRSHNLRQKLVRADHFSKDKKTPTLRNERTRSGHEQFMSKSDFIFNSKSNIRQPIVGGRLSDRGVVYAIRCTKCDLISVGYTTTPLNERLNRHWYDVQNRPEACEVSQHFSSGKCCFKKDIEISILSRVQGSQARMELEEDKWITRINSRFPNGLNERLSQFGSLYYSLF